jgi:hypothetical protein
MLQEGHRIAKAGGVLEKLLQGRTLAFELSQFAFDVFEWGQNLGINDRGAFRCRLTAKLGLVVAGISLRRTPEGRWFCCEVNPSPGFTVYQQATGRRIAEAIADLLAVGRRFAGSMRLARLA